MNYRRYIIALLALLVGFAGSLNLNARTVVWGVSKNGKLYYKEGITKDNYKGDTKRKVWTNIQPPEGKIVAHVDVGPQGNTWITTTNDDIYFRTDVTAQNPKGNGWELIDGRAIRTTVGTNVVWCVNKDKKIYVREGITSDTPMGIDWQEIPLPEKVKIKGLSINKDNVLWVIGIKDFIWIRTGITKETPEGTDWKRIWGKEDSGKLRQITVGTKDDNPNVWGTNAKHEVYQRSNVTHENPEGDDWIAQRHPGDNHVAHLTHITVDDEENVMWGINKRHVIHVMKPGVDSWWKRINGKLKQISIGNIPDVETMLIEEALEAKSEDIVKQKEDFKTELEEKDKKITELETKIEKLKKLVKKYKKKIKKLKKRTKRFKKKGKRKRSGRILKSGRKYRVKKKKEKEI